MHITDSSKTFTLTCCPFERKQEQQEVQEEQEVQVEQEVEEKQEVQRRLKGRLVEPLQTFKQMQRHVSDCRTKVL